MSVTEPVILNVTYNETAGDYPDDAVLLLQTGDGHQIQQDLLGETHLSFMLSMSTAGEYEAQVSVSNLATAVTIPLQVTQLMPHILSVCKFNPATH